MRVIPPFLRRLVLVETVGAQNDTSVTEEATCIYTWKLFACLCTRPRGDGKCHDAACNPTKICNCRSSRYAIFRCDENTPSQPVRPLVQLWHCDSFKLKLPQCQNWNFQRSNTLCVHSKNSQAFYAVAHTIGRARIKFCWGRGALLKLR